tara:strand:+ start:4024 stop:4299 length:276 start_codon:yes stop_codon:yes gene_type:complete
MCMGGGGGGGGGGFGGGGGGGFGGFGNFGTGLSFGGGSGNLLAAPGGGITKPVNPNIKEGQKEFLGSKPGFDEKKLTALANKAGKESLYVS